MGRMTTLLLFLGYSLMFWGSTLIGGGPGNTGAWGFLYTMTKLGKAPETPPVKTGAPEDKAPQPVSTGTNPWPSGHLRTPPPGGHF